MPNYTVSGTITHSDSTPFVGVHVRITGVVDLAVTDESGAYSASVPSGTTGTIEIPEVGPPHSATPDPIAFVNLSNDLPGQDFALTQLYNISGTILYRETGLPVGDGETVQFTDESPTVTNGGYGQFGVADLSLHDEGDSFAFGPAISGYANSPESRGAVNLSSDMSDQDFVIILITWTIGTSGHHVGEGIVGNDGTHEK